MILKTFLSKAGVCFYVNLVLCFARPYLLTKDPTKHHFGMFTHGLYTGNMHTSGILTLDVALVIPIIISLWIIFEIYVYTVYNYTVDTLVYPKIHLLRLVFVYAIMICIFYNFFCCYTGWEGVITQKMLIAWISSG